MTVTIGFRNIFDDDDDNSYVAADDDAVCGDDDDIDEKVHSAWTKYVYKNTLKVCKNKKYEHFSHRSNTFRNMYVKVDKCIIYN